MSGQHRRRTLRGQVVENTVKRLVVDDGRLNHGYRVISFYVATRNPSNAAGDTFATLSTTPSSGIFWEWDDNTQIAWASTVTSTGGGAASGGATAPFVLVDPDHIVIQDLYIQAQLGTGGGTDIINYFIELETVDLSDDESILQLIKERAQG